MCFASSSSPIVCLDWNETLVYVDVYSLLCLTFTESSEGKPYWWCNGWCGTMYIVASSPSLVQPNAIKLDLFLHH